MDALASSDPLRPLAAALSADYDVEGVLGVGGMGTVLRARDRKLDRPVAIKVVAPELVSNESTRRRFLEESRVLARLRHPGIVTVHTAGEAAGLLYFVMDLVPGESLRDRLRRDGRCDSESARRILREIAAALSYAHDHGVVHRDIKPENILLDAEFDRVMLTDFGIARVLADDDDRLTRAGVSLGSPQYMSPEQALGQSDIDGRSDVYALGLVGYEMLAGAPAFSGSQQVVMSKQVTERPPSLVRRASGTPPSLASAIERALEKDPAARWQSAADMVRALDGEPAPEMRRSASRRRALVALGALSAVLVLFVAGNALRGGSGGLPDAGARKSFFIAPFEIQGNDPSLAWLREASMTMLGLNLSTWSDVRVVPYERAIDLLRDMGLDERGRVGLDAARSLARRAGYATVVTGQVVPVRDSLTVVARVYDVADGDLLDTKRVAVAAGVDPRTMFDSLASQLLDLAGAPTMTPDLARITTTSLDAYRAYVAGLHALRRLRYAAADSAFAVAIAKDSAFVLAHYKQALARSWMGQRDTTLFRLTEFAAQRATQLPWREQAIVLGYDAYLRSMQAQQDRRFSEVDPFLAEARRYLNRVLDRDSTDAEAWFLLSETYMHAPDSVAGPGRAGAAARMKRGARLRTSALRALDHAIRYDSSFHVSWQHRMDLYVQVAASESPWVLVGDSLVFVLDEAAGLTAERIREARVATRSVTIRDARQWADADPHAEQAHRALVTAYIAAQHYDSAAGAIREAMRRPEVAGPFMPYWLAGMQFAAGDTQAIATLRQALARLTVDSLRGIRGGLLAEALAPAQALALHHGMLREFGQLHAYTSALAPARQSRGDLGVAWAAVGVDNAEVRAALADLIRSTDESRATMERTGPAPQPSQTMWVAFLGLRDTTFFAPLRRWTGSVDAELLALAALDRGDRSRAVALAASLEPVQALTPAPPIQHRLHDIRRFARAELYARLGDERRALRELDRIDRARFHLSLQSIDPRWGMYARSFFLRGILHEQLGEREKAMQSYRTFLDSWKHADARLQPQLQQARGRLRRLSDASR